MLMPKRVKRRRVHRGRMTGKANKGNRLAHGTYGLVAMEPAWITAIWIDMIGMSKKLMKRAG